MIIYLILVLTVIASGSLIFFFKSGDQRLMKFLLAFSGAFLIGITFLILIPEVYREATVFTGLFVLLGFVLQLFLELITEGAEHGHKHTHSDDERVSPFLLLIGLCIHAFLEGMPLVKNLGDGLTRSLVSGIVVHNIPISLTLMGLFLHYGLSMRKAFVFLFVFAMMTPLGSVFSRILDSSLTVSVASYSNYILAVVVGIFLHVSTTILFETEENHRYNMQKFVTILSGLAIAFAISFFE
ncbi:MAG TPA: ZIP family metal transporter [Bacteroidales bacterium]|nr:ZIP family metal transporter [Bacteroidales bacterium]HPS51005.1 ZIP family metal transporter [Bacteroidales bacterium]